MKNSKKNFGITMLAILSLILPISTFAATTPSLGGAATYGVLGSTYTNTAGSTINGDLGYTTPPAVTPTVNGTTHVADASYNQAGTDQNGALGTLNSQPCTFNFGSPTDLSLLPQPLTPGVYCITAAASIGTGGITLTGSGTYIFRINGALTTVANSSVSLSGGASACDVFWTPTSATTLGANSSFVGTDIDASGITVGSTVAWTGRSLAFGGTVTTNTDTISAPSCGAPVIVSTPAPVIAQPLISVTKIPTLVSSLTTGGGVVAFDYTVSNVGSVTMNNITVNDNKCSPISFISGDTNTNLQLETSETWKYRCTESISQTTTNTVTATGQANGFTATATADATVIVNLPPAVVAPTTVLLPPIITPPVVVPTLPKTGFPPKEKSSPWNIIIPAGIAGILLSFYLARRKQTN
jgi:hypothetical protein